MSFHERNITISLVNFSLILVFFLASVLLLAHNGNFNAANVYRLWGIVAVLATVGTVATIIFVHITTNVARNMKSGEGRMSQDIQDERDKLIDLKGTNVAYRVSSIGVALAMLTLVFGRPPLVLFTLLILSGIVAQIVADISRLYLYRRGF
jgi:beta-lactamase regulating signal transducer with metallopeptidase domain